MSATFSINVGQIVESSKKLDVFKVLLDLPDNTKKLISPRDVRDAFFTTWASSPIKLTSPTVLGQNYTYIGIDSSDPSDRDIKKPILIGKRQYGNLDVMNGNLISTNNADIFFYNTKSDIDSQNSTKISILAGTDSTLHYNAPYIESTSGTNSITLNINNPSLMGGGINIFSSIGRVAINGIVFPTAAETSTGAATGKILRYYGTYPNGYLKWDESTVSLASVGSLTAPTFIYGSTVSVNGYPIEFITDEVVPVTTGGIEVGSTFSLNSFYNSITGTNSNWPLAEVLRRFLYPYVEPVLSLSIQNTITGTTFAEVGTTPSIIIGASLSIFPRSSSEYVSDWTLTGTTYSHVARTTGDLTLGGSPGTSISFTASGDTYSIVTNTTIDYTFAVANNGLTAFGYPFGFSYSKTVSMNFISPFYSKFDSLSILNGTTLATLISSTYSTKKVIPYPGLSQSVKLKANGTGYLFFAYPFSYGAIKTIKDPNGFIIHDVTTSTASLYTNFTYSTTTITPASPYAYYSTYRLYRTKLTCGYDGDGEFEFIF
jgi:hypothetical protein